MRMKWHVHNDKGTAVAQCLHAEDAAALVALYPHGATIRYERNVLWTEGADGAAGDSYDAVAILMEERMAEIGYRPLVKV